MNQAAAPALPTVTGHVEELSDDRLVLDIPHTDYRLHLALSQPLEASVGDKITGTIHAKAKRVDPIRSGGRFIEPNYGRPRRAQGRIVGGDPQANTLYVHCGGGPVIATLMPSQQATDFAIGQMVLFDVERGAVFERTG
jgi:hypothetical protein